MQKAGPPKGQQSEPCNPVMSGRTLLWCRLGQEDSRNTALRQQKRRVKSIIDDVNCAEL